LNQCDKTSADCLLTLGAGSISDACKSAKLGHANKALTRDALLSLRAQIDHRTGAISLPDHPIASPTLKLICIPTSLSGGEFNPNSGILDPETRKKVRIYHPDCNPDVIIYDPFVTAHTPDWVWLSTGIRSVDHAVETLAGTTQLDDFIRNSATNALECLINGLLMCKEGGAKVEGRILCQKGTWHATQAIIRGIPLGGSHAIGHLLGSVAGVAHGYTSCVLLPAVMRYNYKVNAKQQRDLMELFRTKGIIRKLGLYDDGELQIWDCLSRLISLLGLPQTLSDVQLDPARWEAVAVGTLDDFWAQTNPIPLVKKEQVLAILELAA
jgi:maleylacetate reductase